MIRLFEGKKNSVIFLLSILFLLKIPQEDIRFTFWVLGGAGFCFALDFLINRLCLKRDVFSNSAIISGFIVSGILDYRQPWFILIIFSSLAILSKHLIKIDKRHIFNPANFALFAATFFQIPLTWNIESNTLMTVGFGIGLAYMYKKLSHVAGFLLFFSLGALILLKTNPFGIISWFFVFIMLIEPKTSGYGALRGFVFGAIAGTASVLLYKFIPQYNPFVCSLVIANQIRATYLDKELATGK